MSPSPRRQFRDALRAFVPPRLADRGPTFANVGFKFLWSIGAVLDGLADWLTQGMQAHFPGLGTPTALGVEGFGRGIPRMPTETDASYAVRLQTWLQDGDEPGLLKMWGHPFGLLRALRVYLGDVRVRTVDVGGNWHTIETGGAESMQQVPGSWNWQNDPVEDWGQLFVIIYAPSTWARWPAFGTSLPWNGLLTGGRNKTLGQTTGLDVARDVREIVRFWKAPHVRVPWIILAFDPDSFDPDNAATWPDGTWQYYGTGSPLVPARTATARYWTGVD